MPVTTLSNDIGTTPGTVYFRIRPIGAYQIDTGAAITSPPPIVGVTGQWTQTLELNTNIFPADNYWEVWENVPGNDHIWSVRVTSTSQGPTVQQAQIPQPLG